jgi:hypothetical protein
MSYARSPNCAWGVGSARSAQAAICMVRSASDFMAGYQRQRSGAIHRSGLEPGLVVTDALLVGPVAAVGISVAESPAQTSDAVSQEPEATSLRKLAIVFH